MKSPKLWVYNYDFEFELAGRARLFSSAQKVSPWYYLNRTACNLLPLMEPEDSLLLYEHPDSSLLHTLEKKLGFLPHLTTFSSSRESNAIGQDLLNSTSGYKPSGKISLSPWGWSPSMAQISAESPSLEKIKRLNSKSESYSLRQRHLSADWQIPSEIIHVRKLFLKNFEEQLKKFYEKYGDFYVKHAFGASGKLLDYYSPGRVSSKKLKTWLHWAKREGGILLEQAIPIHQEWGLQLHFPPKGKPIFLALTQLFSDLEQSYQGSMIRIQDQSMLGKMEEELSPLIEQIQNDGYQGPLGIDLIESSPGKFKLLEINARYTMGRVAYEWHQKINPYGIGYFSNLFLRYPKSIAFKLLQKFCTQLEKQYFCKITLINLVSSESLPVHLITLFLSLEKQEHLIKIRNQLKFFSP
ncbi:MAG: hypothetical protein COB67_01140 [SAR324 cluster bacterium]|uniref:ATP-grasp domain-containing protein n=1 Tax=SAR324 cluster bacterium TaxID=2024889 RepID=A0A2A4TB34_9DELT|nr:MAG: hypothetical protein COB67_01140 [SAR324 cluster bacterium]